MNNTIYDKTQFKNKLVKNCGGCAIQHTGWPCASCFCSLSDEFDNKEWQTILYYRGDYKVKELTNLPRPQERRDILDKIWNLI